MITQFNEKKNEVKEKKFNDCIEQFTASNNDEKMLNKFKYYLRCYFNDDRFSTKYDEAEDIVDNVCKLISIDANKEIRQHVLDLLANKLNTAIRQHKLDKFLYSYIGKSFNYITMVNKTDKITQEQYLELMNSIQSNIFQHDMIINKDNFDKKLNVKDLSKTIADGIIEDIKKYCISKAEQDYCDYMIEKIIFWDTSNISDMVNIYDIPYITSETKAETEFLANIAEKAKIEIEDIIYNGIRKENIKGLNEAQEIQDMIEAAKEIIMCKIEDEVRTTLLFTNADKEISDKYEDIMLGKIKTLCSDDKDISELKKIIVKVNTNKVVSDKDKELKEKFKSQKEKYDKKKAEYSTLQTDNFSTVKNSELKLEAFDLNNDGSIATYRDQDGNIYDSNMVRLSSKYDTNMVRQNIDNSAILNEFPQIEKIYNTIIGNNFDCKITNAHGLLLFNLFANNTPYNTPFYVDVRGILYNDRIKIIIPSSDGVIENSHMFKADRLDILTKYIFNNLSIEELQSVDDITNELRIINNRVDITSIPVEYRIVVASIVQANEDKISDAVTFDKNARFAYKSMSGKNISLTSDSTVRQSVFINPIERKTQHLIINIDNQTAILVNDESGKTNNKDKKDDPLHEENIFDEAEKNNKKNDKKDEKKDDKKNNNNNNNKKK